MTDDKQPPTDLTGEGYLRLLPLLKCCHREWMTQDKLNLMVDELADHLLALNIPIARVNLTLPTLHPQMVAASAEWYDGGPSTYIARSSEDEARPSFPGSPIEAILTRSVSHIELPFFGDGDLPYAFCEEIREVGFTGYLVYGIENQAVYPNMLSVATKSPDGFSTENVQTLELIVEALGPVLAYHQMKSIAKNVCRTYIGPQTGERVLSGDIRRGTVETLEAVIWFCDLRNFTRLSEELGIRGVTAMINKFFEGVASGIHEHEGEILKFIGDAALAIFPVSNPDERAQVCQRALRAVERVEQHIAESNDEQREQGLPVIRFGVGLNIGEVSYGNVGSIDRLDFTVIGSSVNLASRIEALASQLKHRVLVSEDFAKELSYDGLVSVGTHQLRGLKEAVRVFRRI